MFQFRKPGCVFLGFLMQIAMISCVPRSFNSDASTEEAPNGYNTPSKLGLPNVVNFAQIAGRTSGAVTQPWSDTYWPLKDKGVAHRYVSGVQGITSDGESMYGQIVEMMDAVQSHDPQKLAALSPAEKYDLLTHNGQVPAQPAIDVLKQTAAQTNVMDNMHLAAQQTAMRAQMAALHVQISLLRAQIHVAQIFHKDTTAAQNQIDALSAQIVGIQQQLANGMTSYSLSSAAIAARVPAAAQALAPYMPLTAQSWSAWSQYALNFKGDWGWMGHCHGWSPASLVEAQPLHSVLAVHGSTQIMFLEGDIRGLLTKVWADQQPGDALFGGQRCGSDDFTRDARNRVLDGVVNSGAPLPGAGSCQQNCPIHILNPFNGSALQFVMDARGRAPKLVGVVTQNMGSDQYQMMVYDQASFTEADGDTSKLQGTPAAVHVQIGCRDTNPMLFHLALTNLIADQKRGFVMDITRSSQVWNQPVYAYQIQYLPVPKIDGTLSAPGVPVSVKEVKDAFRVYRANGTAFFVHVMATVRYGKEIAPMATYPANSNATRDVTYVYTLELDANQNLIGGEWGPVPTQRGSVASKDDTALGQIGGDSPDFLWLFKAGATPGPGIIDYGLLNKIHQCSMVTSGVQSTTVGGSAVNYTTCNL